MSNNPLSGNGITFVNVGKTVNLAQIGRDNHMYVNGRRYTKREVKKCTGERQAARIKGKYMSFMLKHYIANTM